MNTRRDLPRCGCWVWQHSNETVLAPRVRHCDGGPWGPRDGALDVQDVPAGVNLVELERVRNNGLVPHPTSHPLSRPDPARVLSPTGRTHLAVHFGRAVRCIPALHVVSLHDSSKSLANPARASVSWTASTGTRSKGYSRLANHVDVLPRNKVVRGNKVAFGQHSIRRDFELAVGMLQRQFPTHKLLLCRFDLLCRECVKVSPISCQPHSWIVRLAKDIGCKRKGGRNLLEERCFCVDFCTLQQGHQLRASPWFAPPQPGNLQAAQE